MPTEFRPRPGPAPPTGMPLGDELRIDPEATSRVLQEAISKRCCELGRYGVVLGLSGGVDSAVVAALCSRAVGSAHVLALHLPGRYRAPLSLQHVQLLARQLGIETRIRSLRPWLNHFPVYRSPLRFFPEFLQAKLVRVAYRYYTKKWGRTPYLASLDPSEGTPHGKKLLRINASYRLAHRLRMVELYRVAEEENRLVVGAANKTEWMIGFFVKFGCDHAADMMPLLGLYKTQVFELARFLNVPAPIIEKPPSPDMFAGITDEFATGIPYAQLDLVLLGLEKGLPMEQISLASGAALETVRTVAQVRELTAHMRVPMG